MLGVLVNPYKNDDHNSHQTSTATVPVLLPPLSTSPFALTRRVLDSWCLWGVGGHVGDDVDDVVGAGLFDNGLHWGI